MSDLVGNPEDRFSHNEAQISSELVNPLDYCIQYLINGAQRLNETRSENFHTKKVKG